jgi:calmodulin
MMAIKILNMDQDLEIRQAFEVFSQGEEFIPEYMITQIMGNLGEQLDDEKLRKMVMEADVDGDGKINYEDFRATMKKGTNQVH